MSQLQGSGCIRNAGGRCSVDQTEARLSTGLEASQGPRSCLGLLYVPENKAKLTRDGPSVAKASPNLVSRTQFYMKE